MKTVLIIFFSLLSVVSNAQLPEFEWAKAMGSKKQDVGTGIRVDKAGNTYIIAENADTMDADPGPSVYKLAKGSFLLKLDPDGNFIWLRSLGGRSYEGIELDHSGNIYVGGDYISRFDSSGTLIWSKQFVTTGELACRALDLDDSGHVITTGYFKGTADFDPGAATYDLHSTGSNYDAYIAKLDSSGNFVWARRFGARQYAMGEGLCIDKKGNINVCGRFNDTVDFDPGSGVLEKKSSGIDAFIAQLTPGGNLNWIKTIGSSKIDNAVELTADTAGNLYIVGGFQNKVDFDPGPGIYELTSANDYNQGTYILKLDNNGDFLWAKDFSGSLVRIINIALDKMGAIYTTGCFQGAEVDFDPGVAKFNLKAYYIYAFITKLDADGNFVWAKMLEGKDQACEGFSISVDEKYSVYTTGLFGATIDFDPGKDSVKATAVSGADIYIHKMSQATLTIGEINKGPYVSLYPNPSNGVFHIDIDIALLGARAAVYNVMGQKISEFILDHTTTIQSLFNGFYIIEISKDDNRIVRKLVVN